MARPTRSVLDCASPLALWNCEKEREIPLLAILDELELQLVQAINSLDVGRDMNGETVFRRLRKRFKEAGY